MTGLKKNDKLEKALSQSVAKSNELFLESRYSLSLREQRALDYAISKIQKDDTPDKIYRVDAREAFSIVTASEGPMGGNDYKVAYQAFASLLCLPVEINLRERFYVTCNWFHHVAFDRKTGTLEFQFNDMLAPHLFNQRKNYVLYDLKFPYEARCVYGPRLYSMLMARSKGKTPTVSIPIDVFKNDIGVSVEAVKNERGIYEINSKICYDQYGKLKERVIDPAVQDINEWTHIFVEYEAIKTGRKVTGIKFTINASTEDYYLRVFQRLDKERHPELDQD